ncbi:MULTISPECIES: hypothetical protein [Gordonia]|nr:MULTISPECIES: hypothetical protein [Gordonia]WFN95158.1 hypothetical protein P5P27_20550 [Gordonia sihwensis]
MPPEVTDPLEKVLGYALWMVMAAAVGRLMWIGGEMSYHRHQPGDTQPPDTPTWVFVGLIVASSASGIGAALLQLS